MAQRKRYKPAGIITDIPPEEVGEEHWTTANNVVFFDKVSKRVDGLAEIYATPLFQPKFLIQSVELSRIFWIYASDTDIGGVEVSTHTDLTPAGGIIQNALNGEWTGGLLNGVPVLNNGASPPMFWTEDLADNFETLPGWIAGETCVALRPFKNHLFALGVRTAAGVFGSKYRWSDGADEGAIPDAWVAAPENEAGDDQLAETRGPIIDAQTLRDSLIIYKRTSCYQVDYVAGNDVFSNRLLFAEVGILARNCVTEVYGQHYVLTAGDVISHDGYKVSTIADEKVRKIIFEQMDPETYITSYVTWDPQTKSVWFCIPTIGHTFPNIAAIYGLADGGVWGIRELAEESPYVTFGFVDEVSGDTYDDHPETYDESSNKYNQVLFSNAIERCVQADYARTKLYAVDVGNTFDGVFIDGYVRKDSMDLGNNAVQKQIIAVWPRTQGEGILEVRLGSQESPEDSPEWGPYKEIISTTEHVDYFMNGRYIAIEFRGTGQQTWQISGFDLEFDVAGEW